MTETQIATPHAGRGSNAQAVPAALLHDLRTPLNHILGYTQMLMEQAREEEQDGFIPDLRNVQVAGGQLLALINSSFDPSATTETMAAKMAGSNGSHTPSELVSGRPISNGAAAATEQAVVLVVDDDAANRDVLARRLKQQGYYVVAAENGSRALDLMRELKFDLVLLDIMMPEMDGFEVLKRLKSDDLLRHIPVIMISAMSEMESAVRCIELGAEDYLPKPFDPTLLKARSVACLDRKRAHDREIRFTAELQKSYTRLRELEQLRDDLTNMIVHDLRTPLTSVITGMQTLEVMGGLDEGQREATGIAIAGGQTLLRMINDLLDVEKMESGAVQLDLAELSAADLVLGAVSQIASLARGKSLTILQQVDSHLPRFQGDEDILCRSLVNLLGNAIKFTPSGGTVTVSAVAQPSKDGPSLLFSVSDTGEGIPPEAYSRIFLKFGQVGTRTAGRKQSTGLGLTFCKLSAEAHGGRVWVESELGKGSTFLFKIPLMSDAQITSAR